ncbi:ABC transporter substrate-binding protein [Bacillus sp. JJ722]|uniref:ABC transporter substrate-binding protein n=1 Tax=Bacillus sp. JJ722 TaxID=3122973 RepID=UPI002FFFCAA9
MKFKTVLISVLLITSIVLTGCGKEESKKGEGVTIEFMHSSVEQQRLEVITDLIKEFEEANPNIKIKQIPVEEDSYNTKVITLASSGKLPAVLEVGQDYAKVMDKEQLIDKDAVGKVLESSNPDNYYEGALKLVRSEDGKQFTGVPVSGWVQGIWYNKEMLASKGFDEPQSWDDVLKIAKAFTNKDNKKYGIALPTAESVFTEQAFSQFALSNNANILDADGKLTLNTPEMKEALSFYKELGSFTMPGSNDTTEVKDAFMNGTAPMALYSTYILPSVFEEGNATNIGFAIPNKEKKAVFGTVSALTISSGLEDDQKAAAEKFIEFMAKPENMTKWILMSPGGAQPVNKQVLENEEYKANKVVNAFGELSNEIAESYNDIEVFGLVDNKNFLKMGDISSTGAIPKLLNEITVGKKKIESEIKSAEAEIKSVLK